MLATRMKMAASGVGGVSGQYYLAFNGSSTIVNCGSDASLDDLHDAAMTVEMWVKMATFGDNNYAYLAAKVPDPFAPEGWLFGALSTKGIQAAVYCASFAGVSQSGTDDFTNDDTWHHVAMTWDNASYNYPRLWIDGVEPSYLSTQNRVGVIESDAANVLKIGNRLAGDRELDGGIAWVRISDIVRYTAGFTPDAKDSPPASDANTVEQWNFNEGSGATAAAEESSPTNDGTISNGSWGSF